MANCPSNCDGCRLCCPIDTLNGDAPPVHPSDLDRSYQRIEQNRRGQAARFSLMRNRHNN